MSQHPDVFSSPAQLTRDEPSPVHPQPPIPATAPFNTLAPPTTPSPTPLPVPYPITPPPFVLKSRKRSPLLEYGLPLLLLVVTLVTTTAMGARYMQNFLDGKPSIVNEGDLWPWPWLIAHPGQFHLGWAFSLTLLTILLAHELGHYFACRFHDIRCTLPWLLPAPTLSGTAGAVIQIRSRIPNRSALIDVGAYGPLAGYVASTLAVAIGLGLSQPSPLDSPRPLFEFGKPITIDLVHSLLARYLHASVGFNGSLRHPILIAGWLGLFITALNLIPAGQLDGGHIVYALSPTWHRRLTRIVPFILFVCGFFFWVGWIFWGLVLLIPAMRHPRLSSEVEPLNRSRTALAVLSLLVFVLAFLDSPFHESSIRYFLH